MSCIPEEIFCIIKDYSGLQATDTHRLTVISHIQKRMADLNLDGESYLERLKTDTEEFTALINAAAVNETYFFREQIQFDFLRDLFFKKEKSYRFQIWSAACSSGQEPLSVYALCRASGYTCDIFASDIDTASLDTFKSGIYSKNSLRKDGSKFHSLIKEIADEEGDTLKIKPEVISAINIFKNNLINNDALTFSEQSLDVIFIRNVFLYFPVELRSKLLLNLARFLKEDGIIFVGVNEIASISAPAKSGLIKEHLQNVYYFRKSTIKKSDEHKTAQTESSLSAIKNVSLQNMSSAQNIKYETLSMQARLISEKQKIKKLAEDIKKEDGTKNPLSSMSREDFCKYFLEQNESKTLEEALNILENCPHSIKSTEYEFYLRGSAFFRKQMFSEAKKHFQKACILNSHFWPALFQAGITALKYGDKKEAATYFGRCQKVLEIYGKDEKTCYNFIVESFSSDYFLELCKKYQKEFLSGDDN